MATRVSSGGDDHDAAGLERVFQARHGDIRASRRRAGLKVRSTTRRACDSASSRQVTTCPSTCQDGMYWRASGDGNTMWLCRVVGLKALAGEPWRLLLVASRGSSRLLHSSAFDFPATPTSPLHDHHLTFRQQTAGRIE